MFDRIIGVFKLDVATFESIEHDESATGQAAMIVLAVGVLGGLGSIAASSFLDGAGGSGGFFNAVLSAFVSWLAWSFLTYFIGTRLFGGEATMGEMMRVIGFAYAPQMLGIIPCLGGLVGLIWSLVAAFVGIRQGLDVSNGKTALTIVVGIIVYVGLSLLFYMLFGGPGVGSNPLEGFTA